MLWQPERIADDLAMNMARTVRWQEAVVSANEREARLAIEMPPGGVLTCLTRQAAWKGSQFRWNAAAWMLLYIWRNGCVHSGIA